MAKDSGGDYEYYSNALIAACCEQNWSALDSILQYDLNPNVRDKSGRTPLHILCDHGFITTAEILIKKGADIELKYNFGRTPLHAAGEAGRESVVDFLIKAGANLEARDNVGRTTLQRVCYKGFLPLAIKLIDAGANIEAQDETGSFPLHSACEKGHTHITSLLLDRGSNINCRDNFGRSPLHLACLYDHLDTVTWLCDRGCTLDIKDIDGRTPLHVASFKDHTEIVAYLIGVGADIEAAANDGRTPLHCAAIKGHTETMFFLLDKHANTGAADVEGLTPLHCACDVDQLEAASCLLDQGADIEAKDVNGKTAMLRVCEKGKWRVASYLRDRGAQLAPGFEAIDSALRHAHITAGSKVVSGDIELETVELDSLEMFILSCETGDMQKCAQLVDTGVDIDKLGKAGYSGLHKACMNGHLNLAMFLLDKSANIENRSRNGRTALHCAVENGYVDLVYALLNRTADVDAKTNCGKTSLYLVCDWSPSNLVVGNQIASTSGCSGTRRKSGVDEKLLIGNIDAATSDDSRTEYGRENCYNRHVELAAALLEFGANPNLKPPGYNIQCPCQIVDTNGNLILHRALIQLTYLCSFEESYFVGIVLSLLKAYPEGARVRNKASQFPLNIALENDACIDVVGPLIEASNLRRHEINSICRSALNSSWCNIDSLHYMLYALQQKHVVANVHIHLCGDTLAGKTTACRALTYLLAPARKSSVQRRDSKTTIQQNRDTGKPVSNQLTPSPTNASGASGPESNDTMAGAETGFVETVSWLGTLSPARKVKSIDAGSSGRTVGLDLHPIRNGQISWLLHDYGGRDIFHSIHGCFLARPRSVFVIVVSPWDATHKRLLSDESILSNYKYWLRLINSVADRPKIGTPSLGCITVINSVAEVEAVERGRTKRVKELIAAEQQNWYGMTSSHHVHISTNHQLGMPSASSFATLPTSASANALNNTSCAQIDNSSLDQAKSTSREPFELTKPSVHSGYMMRQSEVQKSWRRRFYMLELGVLRYYDTDPNAANVHARQSASVMNASDEASLLLDVAAISISKPASHMNPKPVGEIFLQDYTIQMQSDSRFVLVNLYRKSRELVLEVVDPVERMAWIRAFKKHFAYLWHQYRIQLIGEPHVINLSLTSEVNGLLQSINDVIKSMNLSTTPTSRCMEIVLNEMIVESNVKTVDANGKVSPRDQMILHSKWPSVLTAEALRDEYIIPALRQLRSADSSLVDKCVFQWLYSLVLKQLVSAGEVVLATAEDGKKTWAVTDVNWLTRDLLGRLIVTMYDKQPYIQPMFTVPQLNAFVGDVSGRFDGDESVFPQLLTALGVCIPISDITGPYIPQKEDLLLSGSSYGMLLFPLFVDIPGNPESIQALSPPPVDAASQKYYRQVIRRFKLQHPTTQSCGFPAGYLSSLFSAIAELEHNTRDIIMTRDSLIIQRCYSLAGTIGNRVEIIVQLDPTANAASNDNYRHSNALSFVVVVSTLMAHPPSGGRSYAWRRMQSICEIIRSRQSKKKASVASGHGRRAHSPSSHGDANESLYGATNKVRSRGGSVNILSSNEHVSDVDDDADDVSEDINATYIDDEPVKPAAEEGKCDHSVEGFRQSLGMVLTWIKNVDVVEFCVDPTDQSVEMQLSLAQACVQDCGDPVKRLHAQTMFYGINERGVAAVEEAAALTTLEPASRKSGSLQKHSESNQNSSSKSVQQPELPSFQSVATPSFAPHEDVDMLADADVFFDILEQLN